jgi:phosphoenolpyruvate carboxylase
MRLEFLRDAGRLPIFRLATRPTALRRNLEILAAATLEATLLQADQAAPREEYFLAMEELSHQAYRGYRNLVYETAGSARSLCGLNMFM